MKHVLMLSAQFLPEVFGGAEQQCRRLCRALVERGISITLITSRSSRSLLEREEIDGIQVLRPYTFHPPDLMGRYVIASVCWAAWVRNWFKRHAAEVDLLHVHQFKFPAFVAATLKRDFGTPLVVKPGNAGLHSDFASLRRKRFVGPALYRGAMAAPDRFVAISTEIEREMIERGISENRRCLIPNGVMQTLSRTELASAKGGARQTLRMGDNAGSCRVFVFTGRLEPVKNLQTLLAAFARLPRTGDPRAVLWIVGAGGERAALEAMAGRLGIAESVKFWGYQKDVRPFLLAADYFVLPSLAEGMSNALLEAMAVGLPPISTPVSGSGDLIADGMNGFLAASSDEPALQASFQRAMALNTNMVGTLGARAYATIAERFSIETITSRYMDLYRTLLSGPTVPVTAAARCASRTI